MKIERLAHQVAAARDRASVLHQCALAAAPEHQAALTELLADLCTALDELEAAVVEELPHPGAREQSFLNILMDNIPDGIYFKDTEGRFLQINRGQAHNLCVANEADALGKTDFDFFDHDHAEQSRQDEQNIMTSGIPLLDRIEHYLGANGKPVWISTTKVPMADARGQVTGVVGISRDITERMEIEVELEHEREFLKTMLGNLSDGIAACNSEGVLTLFNDAARAFHNLPAEPLPAEQWATHYDLYLPDGQTLMSPADVPLFRALQGEAVRNVELMIMPKDGRPRTIVANANALFDAQGQKIGAVAAMRDITEQKRAESALRQAKDELERRVAEATAELRSTNRRLQHELTERRQVEVALRESEERYRRLVELSPEAIAVHSEGKIVFVNAAAVKLLGAMDTGQLLGRPVSEVVHPDYHASIMQWTKVMYQAQGPVPLLEQKFVRLDGQVIDVEVAAIPSTYAGQPAAQVVVHDITARKRSEQERAELLLSEQAARAEAEAAIVLRDEFLSVAAHELKTPVTALLGYTQLLVHRREQGDALTERTQRAFHVMADQTERLSQLIVSLLDISRLRVGHFSIEHRPVDISALARRVVAEMQLVLQQHTLVANIPDAAVMIIGDDLRLEQVLQNLLQNAVKYSPSGGTLSLGIECVGGSVAITVSDQGMGIPPESSAHLFQRFYRATNVESSRISGMGLGLYIVKEIVDRHGGTVGVQSTVGEGSTFTVRLPLASPRASGMT